MTSHHTSPVVDGIAVVKGASDTAAGAINVDGVTANVVGACMVVTGAASVTGNIGQPSNHTRRSRC